MIIDTNVLVYLSKYLIDPKLINTPRSAISIITKIEALGYKFSNPEEHQLLSDICNELPTISLSNEIANETINSEQILN